MIQIASGNVGPGGSVNVADVDADGNLRISPKHPALGALGAYSVGKATGALAATIAANSDLFSARWGDSSGKLSLIERVSIIPYTNGTITAAVQLGFGLFIAKSFTVSPSGGTDVKPAAAMQKRRSSQGNSLFTAMQLANTAALTTGTRTLDTNPLRRTRHFNTGTTAPAFWAAGDEVILWDAYQAGGWFHPIILKQDEGIVLQNLEVGPATGTWILVVNVDWLEVNSY